MRALLSCLLAGVLVATVGVVVAAAPATAAGPCARPVFRTSAHSGHWSRGHYTVDNDMWNAAGHHMRQRLTVCSRSSWYADARLPRHTDNQVKSYPNAHRDFHNWSTHTEPRLAAYRSLRASWASRTPRAGRWDAGWDLWIDGVPGDDRGTVRTEVMVWTDNHGTAPLGHRVASARFAGRRWQVWRDRTAGHPYVAFVPRGRIPRGAVDMVRPLTWLRRHHWLHAPVTLGQIGFGYEIVATGGRRLHFATTGFSVRAVRR